MTAIINDNTSVTVTYGVDTEVTATYGVDTEVTVSWIAGLPGPAGDGITFVASADQAIGGHRVVRSTATGCDYADSSNLTHLGKVIGMTNEATSSGNLVKIWPAGKITDPSFNFDLGPVYLSTNGLLTQTPPTTGFIQQIGVALSQTTILVQILNPIAVI